VTEVAASGRALARRFHAAIIAAVVVVVATAYALGTGLGSLSFSRNLGNVLEILAPALATACCIRVARRAGDSWRTGWYLCGASCALWMVGQSIWTWLETVQGQISPFPSPADFFFLLAVPFAVAGLLWFPSSPDTQSGRTRTLLDGIIVAASVLFVSWTLVLGPGLRTGEGSAWARAIGLAYPAADVVVLTIVIIAYVRCDPAGRVAVGLVGLAFTCFALADSLFAYTDVHGESVSEISNTAWVAGYLLIALGAYYALLHPPADADPTADLVRGTRLQVLLPYVPLGIVLGLCVGEALATDPLVVDNVVFWIGAGLIALLLVRQGIVIVENTRLARSLAMSNERLQYQVLHDVLTSLPNRPLLIDHLRMALARMSRAHELVAIMFVDLDRFKPVNDTYGHEAGDQVLVALGRRLSAAVRAGDTVARFGGDEFLVLCENVNSVEEAVALANRMVETMAEPILVGAVELVVSASFGLVVTDSPAVDAEELVRQADRAMYEAKRKGRARVELVDARSKQLA